MLSLKVSGMTCGGCINAITRAIQARDPAAIIQADLATQMVTIQTSLGDSEASRLIIEAGFSVSN